MGLPRLSLFGAHAVSPQLQLGAAVSWALQGGRAPSVELSAPVITALALGAYQLASGTLLSLQAGFRLDESARAAPDVKRLSPADRMALGLSDFHALPVGIAVIQRLGRIELAGELSGELLLGAKAPALLKSPLRAALVARLLLTAGLSLEVLARFGLEPLGMLVGDLNGELIDQLRGCLEHGRRVRELREHNETHGQKRRRARNRGIDHREHSIGVRTHRTSIEWIREIRLTRRY